MSFSGSSSGLGCVTAVAFAFHGARIVLTGRDEEGLQRTEDGCVDAGLQAHKVGNTTPPPPLTTNVGPVFRK